MDAAGRLSAFDLNSGELVWKLQLQSKNGNVYDTAIKGAGIALNNGVVCATTGYGAVYAVNAQKGEILWTKSLQTPIRIAPMAANGNVFGTQFHPEKSGEVGMKILKAFCEM